MTIDEQKHELEIQLQANRAGEFVKAVARAQSGDVDMLMTTVEAFAGEPDVLYAALKYASLSGVEVRIAPRATKAGAA